MSGRAVEYYRLINRPGQPEDSRGFRVAVLITVLISVMAAVQYGTVGGVMGALVIAGVVAGSIFSYYTRGRANLLVKLLLSILLLVIFVIFWTELGASIHDLRYPLVRLFLWLQVLHSFDLPTRRDLDFSLVSSAILIAFAGSLSISSDFLYYVIPFFASGLAALYLGHKSALKADSDVFVEGRRRSWRPLLVAAAAVVPVAVFMFMLLPRLPGFNSYYLPMSGKAVRPESFAPLIKNPGYKNVTTFPTDPLPFNADAYFGFNDFLDLRVRGVPSDKVVMKVRSSKPDYWRATAFDVFRGNGWENSEKEREEITSGSLPLTVTFPGETTRYATRELVQTFFIERQLPNTLFAAYIARDLYFPTQVLKVDSMMSVLLPVTLDPGLIYTVVSEVSDVTPEILQMANGRMHKKIVERFTQLPPMSPQVAQLAQKVTAGAETQYDRVKAICSYLQQNYPYDLSVERQGRDENTVEFFLFKAKRGYCEHFATTAAVMCRTLGIPTRIAVGYDTGRYNSLTGYYEVSGRDAHAWFEVYFPPFGWISFDPTPGWTDPYTLPSKNTTWTGFTLVQGIGRALGKLLPDSWGRGLKSAALSIGRALKAAGRSTAALLAVAWPYLIALAALLVGLFLWSRRRRRAPPGLPRPEGLLGPRERAARAFERMVCVLGRAGIAWRPAQTAVELGRQADASLGFDLGTRAAALFNKARFGKDPSPEDLDELDHVVTTIDSETP